MCPLQESSPIPLYLQLKESLLERINQWEFTDHKLPNEEQLTKEYNVSKITVRRALFELKNEGYIYRKQGLGTFILPRKIEQSLTSFYSFSSELEKRNIKVKSEVLALEEIVPDQKIAAKLKLNPKDKVYFLKRLRFAENTPIMIEYSYLPSTIFPNLDKKDFVKRRLYDIMREDYGIYPVQADLTFGAKHFTPQELNDLQIDEAYAALKQDRLTYASTQEIIEYSKASICSERYEYHIRIGST